MFIGPSQRTQMGLDSSRLREPLGQAITVRIIDLAGKSNDCPSLRKVKCAPSREHSLLFFNSKQQPLIKESESIRLPRGDVLKRVGYELFGHLCLINDINPTQCGAEQIHAGSK